MRRLSDLPLHQLHAPSALYPITLFFISYLMFLGLITLPGRFLLAEFGLNVGNEMGVLAFLAAFFISLKRPFRSLLGSRLSDEYQFWHSIVPSRLTFSLAIAAIATIADVIFYQTAALVFLGAFKALTWKMLILPAVYCVFSYVLLDLQLRDKRTLVADEHEFISRLQSYIRNCSEGERANIFFAMQSPNRHLLTISGSPIDQFCSLLKFRNWSTPIPVSPAIQEVAPETRSWSINELGGIRLRQRLRPRI